MSILSYSSAQTRLFPQLSELTAFFCMRIRSLFHRAEVAAIFSDFREYDSLLQWYAHNSLEKAKVFEIGYGARPNRLLALISLGVDARGVDLDVPVLRGSLCEFVTIYRTNGAERLLKSLVRFPLFDLLERYYLDRALQTYGKRLTIVADRFLMQDAASVEVPEESFDLIFSEDVFEHIPAGSLERLIPQLAKWLKPDGLALIRPNIFTGIAGGHLAEWFPHTLQNRSRRRKSEPWEHLRKDRYQANTYLNHVTRAEYRSLFAGSFHILEERVKVPYLGREFFSAEVQADLREYQEEELFSNQVLFVLQPRKAFIKRETEAR